jgi:tRNA A37 methylthiotransferase MiaB
VLREMAAEKNRAFRESFIGRTLEVITLQAGGEGWTEGLSDNFLKVRLAGRHCANQWATVKIHETMLDGLLAESLNDYKLLFATP